MAIWDPQHETIDRERLEELQLARLREMLYEVHGASALPPSADGAGFRARRPQA